MSVPQHLGPYKIGKQLGKGGMGAVFEAINEDTGERVAVKTLAAELAGGEGFQERFQAEIESLRTLRHPNIVRLYGYGEEDGTHFYSMELVHGVSLEEELRRGRRFDWREVTRIAIQVSRALKHAHDHGIIHRDIKPANILLAGEQVKLADFGIAQLFGGAKLTTARGVVGTADFMSPEQAASRPITDRCDQYSLGCVMYALLAGRPPFRAKGLPEMLQLQRYADPEPVTRFAPDTPKQLERVVTQLLEKSPKDRFPNALALAKHLEAMSLAMSRPVQPDSDFQLANEEEHPRDPSELSETPAVSSEFDSSDLHDYETLAPPTVGPAEVSLAMRPSTIDLPPATPAERERRFTAVADEPLLTRAENRALWQLVLQGVLLATLLLGALGLVTWLAWPPSADEVYGRITAAADQGDQALLGVERDISRFLERFPDDPRAAELEPLQEQLAFAHTERRMFAKLRLREASDAPIESLYLQAMRRANDQPEHALRDLQAIIGLLKHAESDAAQGEDSRALLQLVEEQARRLERRVERRSKSQLPFLEERLSTAEALASDAPSEAADICRSILQLYGELDWAEPAVGRARALLSEVEPKQ
ncbi:Serine/threonine-protein kinase PknB [Posidoniimonas polymericola]|uniref:Serine/threonine-protein kinase PknB n=1 Tax=Posidoniimonas polymericola TaxID=2528002 RepID=A0A5C5YQ56_9BACT|nr:serine/threonine-protein kinase [Posidoniimonas polymericola]TWT77064.1 Serine/threonine-protein kinase PknB [Posidoniimonas polymericola]